MALGERDGLWVCGVNVNAPVPVASDTLGIIVIRIDEAFFDTGTGKIVALAKVGNILSERFDERHGLELVLDTLGLYIGISSGRVYVV